MIQPKRAKAATKTGGMGEGFMGKDYYVLQEVIVKKLTELVETETGQPLDTNALNQTSISVKEFVGELLAFGAGIWPK